MAVSVIANFLAPLSEPFQFPFMQRAAVEMLLLSLSGGLLGSWVVLRRLAFFTHAVGTATFPGLALAGAAGFSPQLAALAVSLTFTFGVDRNARKGASNYDVSTGLALVAMLAIGVILTSDVFQSGAAIDRLLFGSLLGIGNSDLLWSLGTAIGTVLVTGIFFRSWLATGFDPQTSETLGVKRKRVDGILLGAITIAVVASLSAVGSLLVSVIFVLPAATVVLFSNSVSQLIGNATVLATFEGITALILAYQLDAPPGPVTAVIAGSIFLLCAVFCSIRRRHG